MGRLAITLAVLGLSAPVQAQVTQNRQAYVLFTTPNNPPFLTTPAGTPQQRILNFFQRTFNPLWTQRTYGHHQFTMGPVLGPFTIAAPAGSHACVQYPTHELDAMVKPLLPPGTTEIWYFYSCTPGTEPSFSYYSLSMGTFPTPSIPGYVLRIDSNGYPNEAWGWPRNVPDGSALKCTANGVQVPLSNTCVTQPRADPAGVKGNFLSPGQIAAGNTWIPSSAVTSVSSTGTYHLAPLEVPGGATMLLRTVDSHGFPNGYTIEYRQRIAPDQAMGPGLWIRKDGSVLYLAGNGGNKNNFAMPVGGTLQLLNGWIVTFQAGDSHGADVVITVP